MPLIFLGGISIFIVLLLFGSGSIHQGSAKTASAPEDTEQAVHSTTNAPIPKTEKPQIPHYLKPELEPLDERSLDFSDAQTIWDAEVYPIDPPYRAKGPLLIKAMRLAYSRKHCLALEEAGYDPVDARNDGHPPFFVHCRVDNAIAPRNPYAIYFYTEAQIRNGNSTPALIRGAVE